jgi:hypothetical protein
MKNLITLLVLFFICTLSSAQINSKNHYVNGYYRSNGTYVKGHYITNPNATKLDNYSTFPNFNPYTGKQGVVKVYHYKPIYKVNHNYNHYPVPRNTYRKIKVSYNISGISNNYKKSFKTPKTINVSGL